jgi:hypothetical protein
MLVQQRQCALDLDMALGPLRAAEVEGGQCLFECEQVLVASVAQQARSDLALAGLDARVAADCQRVRVMLSGRTSRSTIQACRLSPEPSSMAASWSRASHFQKVRA